MPNRNPKTALSALELTTLRHVASGDASGVVAEHLNVLLSMGLAGLGMNGRASLSEEGQRRLREAESPEVGYR
jgi:hypothetical protein